MNIAPRQAGSPPAPPSGPRADDPRLGLMRDGAAAGSGGPAAAFAAAPFLHHRRDGILPAVAGALSVRGGTLTGTGSRSDTPPGLHPLVADFLAGLPTADRGRSPGRCSEAVLLSRFLNSADAARSGRKAEWPMSEGEARKALKQARLTARHVREDGDPRHGAYAPPCRSCARLLDHFGVAAVDPGAYAEAGAGEREAEGS
ncbi:hypothetical protein E4198_16260 [Streptomyces sp. RKND-216]|nr:hypothetical protein E4198_16260 [Streptomyces sp. RKND-216]